MDRQTEEHTDTKHADSFICGASHVMNDAVHDVWPCLVGSDKLITYLLLPHTVLCACHFLTSAISFNSTTIRQMNTC